MYNTGKTKASKFYRKRCIALILHDCSHRCAGIIYSYKNVTYIGGYTVVLVLVELSGFQAKKRHTLCDLHCTTTVAVALVELSGLGG